MRFDFTAVLSRSDLAEPRPASPEEIEALLIANLGRQA